MFGRLRNLAVLPSFTLPIITKSFDDVAQNSKTVQEMNSAFQQETGWDRLQSIMHKDDFGRLTPELSGIVQVACMSCVAGLLYGGITYSREAYVEFINNNQATAFKNHFEAKKKLQDKIALSFAKGGFMWAWRLTFFSTTYAALSTSISVYRGKSGVLEHTIAGFVAGASYKFKLGPAAMLVGGGLGMALGTFAGFMQYSFLTATGRTMEEVRYWNYNWVSKRSEKWNQGMDEHKAKEDLLLVKERNLKTNLQSLDSMKFDNEKS